MLCTSVSACGISTMFTGEHDISINVAEVLGMAMSATMLVIS